MNIKQILWIIFIGILASRCFAVNDAVGYSNYNVGNVQVITSAGTITVPISQYIKGVLYKEIKAWSDSSHQAAFTAQAIAIRTFLQNYNNNHIDPNTNNPLPIAGDTTEQDYDNTYDGSNPVIEQAYVLAGTTVLKYPGSSSFIAAYFGSTGAFTTPSERSDQYGNWKGYLRASPNTEPSDLYPPAESGNGVGMGQAGAFYLSEQGQSANNILLHYYHSSPPIAKSVSIYQGGIIEGDDPNNTHDSTVDISGET